MPTHTNTTNQAFPADKTAYGPGDYVADMHTKFTVPGWRIDRVTQMRLDEQNMERSHLKKWLDSIRRSRTSGHAHDQYLNKMLMVVDVGALGGKMVLNCVYLYDGDYFGVVSVIEAGEGA